MNFDTYWQGLTAEQREELATRMQTSSKLLRNLATGKQAGPHMAVRIESATDKRVTRKDLRPNDWAQLWPELAEQAA